MARLTWLRQRGAGNQGSGHWSRAQGCEPVPQNNQLQELPYNELSRLSSLRTLNLHNNLISSEGEGEGPAEAGDPRVRGEGACGGGRPEGEGEGPAEARDLRVRGEGPSGGGRPEVAPALPCWVCG